ncbi:MAG: aminotransferase class I/II-fold pyridoxal phosphate-dependent enzyme [Chloroflexi bacterium]|nr:aminotransferase class I/II-fold pyridoxal phosphate-dependent enzyme [Chloroflexota bacterium]
MAPRPRDHIARLEPYEWEAMATEVAAAAGIPESRVVRFDTNTTSWPPVAWEQTVLDAPRMPANEYPHPSNEPLRTALAQRLGVTPDQVVVTCGADEALQLIATAYLGPDRVAVVGDPLFSMFRVVTESVGATLRRVPVGDDWHLPRDALLDAVRDPAVGVVWLCSPNNPTGTTLAPDLVEEVLEAAPHAVVALDEAYFEFYGQTLAPLLLKSPNGVLVRTFSKGYGLAGARVGYLVANLEITRVIESIRLPQNLTAFGITAACRALADQAGLAERVAAILAERSRLSDQLRQRGWEVLPSEANFVLAKPPAPAGAVATWLQGDGLIVRSYAGHPRLHAWLRLSVRSPEEDDRLLARLDALPRP